MRHTNDTLLISRVMLFDDRRAFATLVEQHQPTIRRFFLHQTMGDEMLSDDLAQETFIKLYYSIKQFKGLANLSTYLYRIAYMFCKTICVATGLPTRPISYPNVLYQPTTTHT